MDRPVGVATIAVVFLCASSYLTVVGLLKLIRPELVSLSLGAPLLHGLEIAGPAAFLIVAAVGAAIAIGLLRLSRIARRAAIVVVLAGVVMLVPTISAETTDLSWRFLFGAVAVISRVMIAWYLWQSWTAEKFVRR